MTTVVDLNNNFFEAINAAIESLPQEKRASLTRLQAASRVEIEELAKRDNSARGPIMRLLTGKVPEEAQLTEIKKGFDDRHKDLVMHLKATHEKQYEAFDLAMEDGHFTPAERLRLLTQLKNAQQAQLKGLNDRADNDQKRLDNIGDLTTERDQKFSLYMLDRAEKKHKPIVQRYRPFGISPTKMASGIKQMLGYETDVDPSIGEVGEVEIKQAKKFSVEDVEFESDTPTGEKQWRAKDKKNMVLGATQAGRGRKKSTGEETAEEWAMITKDYLAGREGDRIVIDDLPAAGIFKGKGPVAFYQAVGILAAPHLVIELNATVLKDEKKGISEDATGVVRCTFPVGASREQKIVVLNVLAHVYKAKGWEGVELGNQTPQDLWEEAYIACRKVGFSHEQIHFKGALLSEKVRLRGDEERKKLENAYKEKEKNPAEPKIDEAIGKLAKIIYNPDLSRETFFALDETEQQERFAQGGLDQQAEIIADYAFDETTKVSNTETKLSRYMKIVAGEAASAEKVATVLDGVAERNPARLLAAFGVIGHGETAEAQGKKRQAVFNLLKTETRAQLLMQLPLNRVRGFFERLPQPESNAPDPKFHLLTDPHLSDVVIYELYRSLAAKPQANEEYSKRHQALNYLAHEPRENQKALGAIVAQSFLRVSEKNAPAMKSVVNQLTRILDKQKAENKNVIMTGIYEALPADKKALFLTRLGQYENLGLGSTRELRDLYSAVDNNRGRIVPLPTTVEIANSLRQFSAKERAEQLEELVKDIPLVEGIQKDAEKAKVTKMAVQLGPELVGKALAGFQNPKNVEALVMAIQGKPAGQSNSEFLANVLSVYDNNSKKKEPLVPEQPLQVQVQESDEEKARAALFNSPNLNVAAILPYVTHPKLIKQLVENRKPADIIGGINAAANNKAQQENIFKQLSPQQQLDVMFDNSVTLSQRSILFASLGVNEQKEYIQDVLSSQNQQMPLVADHLLACWKNAYLSEPKDHHEKSGHLLTRGVLELFVKQSSKTNTTFLTCVFAGAGDDLSTAFKDVMTLNQRFQGIPQPDQAAAAKETYLMNVGRAIAELADKPKQLALFVGELNNLTTQSQNPIKDKDATSVRAHALIALMAKGDRQTAHALFRDANLAQPTRDALRDKVVALANEFSLDQKFQRSLYAVVGYTPPAQAQQQNQSPAPHQ